MVNIEKAKEEFIKYVENYDITNGRIKLKMDHILHVADNCKLIAKNLNLSEEYIELAELIGIFHDIGRFEQARVYDTFSDRDSGVDHAAYSLKVLYEDGLISKFIDTDKYDDIIKDAVFNHNKAKIDEDVKGDALLFSKIIRDADKLDIYRVINEDAMEDVFWYREFENLEMDENLFNKFINDRFISYKDIKNNADQILAFYNYIYDFNFPFCLKLIKERQYLESFLERVKETFKSDEITKKTEMALKACNDFIEEN